ncbi:CD99 antigen-like protein 2 [Notothenia coriiceps]|uniref:CD99 antigen-like protein 2 n=1 Tax=Notothenia coriiceps TaxID=8208 RepID=A0A6I9Q4J3_9TELE|nr:PREDICTED: CD99 antigen-like protein 2 [Notothenia coriiceps]
MASRSLWSLVLLLALLLPLEVVLSQDFDLADALGDGTSKPSPTPASKPAAPAAPAGGAEAGAGFDSIGDITTITTKAPSKAVTKAPFKPKPKPGERILSFPSQAGNSTAEDQVFIKSLKGGVDRFPKPQ